MLRQLRLPKQQMHFVQAHTVWPVDSKRPVGERMVQAVAAVDLP
jgi:hypothetical protein